MIATSDALLEPDFALLAAAPDSRGRFGEFGGRFVPETIIPALDELDVEYTRA